MHPQGLWNFHTVNLDGTEFVEVSQNLRMPVEKLLQKRELSLKQGGGTLAYFSPKHIENNAAGKIQTC